MAIEAIGFLVVLLLVFLFLVEFGIPAILNDREYFWVTKSLFKKKKDVKGMTLKEQIEDAKDTFEEAKRKFDVLRLSADKKSRKARRELEIAGRVYETSKKNLDTLNKTKIKT
jgi:hypothetical protein